jgi:hypothetical protein
MCFKKTEDILMGKARGEAGQLRVTVSNKRWIETVCVVKHNPLVRARRLRCET